MRIRTRLVLMGLLPLGIGIANVSVISWTAAQTTQIEKTLEVTEKLETAISELNLLGSELLKPGSRERVIIQWRQRRLSVTEHLKSLHGVQQNNSQLPVSVQEGFQAIDQLLRSP